MTTITKFAGSVTVDAAGRILIPVQIRESLGLQPGKVAQIEVSNGSIKIQANEAKCQGCGSDLSESEMSEFPIVRDVGICRHCILTALANK